MTTPASAANRAAWADAVLDAALELPAQERQAFVESRCAGHPELESDVLQLLAALETPAPMVDGGVGRLLPEAISQGDDHSSEPAPGAAIGPWRIVRPLGRGGM